MLSLPLSMAPFDEPSSRKRARADEGSTSTALSRAALAGLLSSLSHDKVVQLLLDSAERDPCVSADIEAAAAARKREELERSLDFGHLYNSISYDLHNTPAHRQTDVGYEVVEDIESVFSNIEQETPPHASTSTKLSALETMYRILEDAIFAPSDVGRIARRNYSLGDEMANVARGFNEADRQEAHESGLFDKLAEFQKTQRGYGGKWDIGDVLQIVSRRGLSCSVVELQLTTARPGAVKPTNGRYKAAAPM